MKKLLVIGLLIFSSVAFSQSKEDLFIRADAITNYGSFVLLDDKGILLSCERDPKDGKISNCVLPSGAAALDKVVTILLAQNANSVRAVDYEKSKYTQLSIKYDNLLEDYYLLSRSSLEYVKAMRQQQAIINKYFAAMHGETNAKAKSH